MKKLISIILALFVAGGYHAIAETAVSSGSDTAGTTQPEIEKTTFSDKTPPTDTSKGSIKNNIFYGGYLNLSFGSYTVIGIEPMLGYRLTPKLSTGTKVRYDYIQDDRYAKSYTTSTYGGSIFARYRVTPVVYAHVETATYNYEFFYLNGGSEREWVPFLFVGGGFVQPLGERSWLNFQVLFDVMQSDKSPYEIWEPFFSIGVGTGF